MCELGLELVTIGVGSTAAFFAWRAYKEQGKQVEAAHEELHLHRKEHSEVMVRFDRERLASTPLLRQVGPLEIPSNLVFRHGNSEGTVHYNQGRFCLSTDKDKSELLIFRNMRPGANVVAVIDRRSPDLTPDNWGIPEIIAAQADGAQFLGMLLPRKEDPESMFYFRYQTESGWTGTFAVPVMRSEVEPWVQAGPICDIPEEEPDGEIPGLFRAL